MALCCEQTPGRWCIAKWCICVSSSICCGFVARQK